MAILIVDTIAIALLAFFLYRQRKCYLPIRSKKEMLSDFENKKNNMSQ